MKIYSERIKNILVESFTLNVFNISFSTGTILWTLFKLVWEFSASNVFWFSPPTRETHQGNLHKIGKSGTCGS